jgi:hypothetical protein
MAEKHRENGPQDNPGSKDDDRDQRDEQPLENQDVPVTGSDYAVGNRLDEVEMSDLVDLSDSEEMDDLAELIDPRDIPDIIDSSAVEMSKYTDDPDILEDLSSRNYTPSGTEDLLTTLKNHTSESPNISGDDIDAAWWSDRESGEESVGGSVATPEQNIIGELGEATGIEYNDFEPLRTEDKLDERDKNRWELNAASADDDETLVDYDKDKYHDHDTEDYSKVDQSFSKLMNDKDQIGDDLDEFGDSIEDDTDEDE